MSSIIPSIPPDANIDAKKWQDHCAELQEESHALQQQLAVAQSERDRCLQAWIKLKCTDDILLLTNEEILSCIGREPPLRDLISGLEGDSENR